MTAELIAKMIGRSVAQVKAAAKKLDIRPLPGGKGWKAYTEADTTRIIEAFGLNPRDFHGKG